jgi:hypothetical protein
VYLLNEVELIVINRDSTQVGNGQRLSR